MFVTAKVLYYGILLSAYRCFFQQRSAKADTTSTKVALRPDAPLVVFVVVFGVVGLGVVILMLALPFGASCVEEGATALVLAALT